MFSHAGIRQRRAGATAKPPAEPQTRHDNQTPLQVRRNVRRSSNVNRQSLNRHDDAMVNCCHSQRAHCCHQRRKRAAGNDVSRRSAINRQWRSATHAHAAAAAMHKSYSSGSTRRVTAAMSRLIAASRRVTMMRAAMRGSAVKLFRFHHAFIIAAIFFFSAQRAAAAYAIRAYARRSAARHFRFFCF
jgi:hypothetical protein